MLAAAICVCSACAAFHGKASISQAASSRAVWRQVAEGAGGFEQGHDIASDNSYVVRTDTGGAYLWNPNGTAPNGTNGVWQQLVSATSMPVTYVAAAQLYDGNNIGGVWEIRFDYAASQYMYMVKAIVQLNNDTVNCGLYFSSNKGTTWTLTNFTPISCNTYFPANDSSYKFYGSKIALDSSSEPPQNIYVGSQGDGLFVSTNGGSSFNHISSSTLPFGSGAGITGLEVHNGNVFACVNRIGVYESSDQGSSWTKLITGTGPKTCLLTAIDHNNGDYYAIDGACENLWVYNGSTWTKLLTTTRFGACGGGVQSASLMGIAVDPNNSGHLVVVDGQGNLNESFNSGSSWSGFSGNNQSNAPTLSTTGDIPWQATLSNGKSLYVQGSFFDQSSARNRFGTKVANKLYINGENDFFAITLSADLSTNTSITANSQGRGIEQLVGNAITASPTSPTTVLFGVWDHGIFGYANSTSSLSAYPSAISPVNTSAICASWSQDYAASSPSSIISVCDGFYANASWEFSSFSSNSGSSWTKYTSFPWNHGNGGQNVAVSTSSNCVWAPAGSGTLGVAPSYSTNCNSASPTWNTINLPGSPSLTNFLTFHEQNHIEVAADRVDPGYFYLVIPGGKAYYSTNGGSTWTAGGSTPPYGSQIQLKATPGVAQDLWFSPGYSASPGQQPNGGYLYHSNNGGQSFTQLTNIGSPYCIGFGAPAPEQTYPSLYTVGYALDRSTSNVTMGTGRQSFTVSQNSTYYRLGQYVVVQEGGFGTYHKAMVGQVKSYNPSNGALRLNVIASVGSGTYSSWTMAIFGPWESDNEGVTWKMIGPQQWPNNGLETARDCMGDPHIYGRMYISLSDGAVYYP